MILVLDTHPLVWFLEASPRLSTKARSAIFEPASELVIPTIVLAEITYLYERKRIATPVSAIRQRLLASNNTVLFPLDERVVEEMPTSLDIHDAIIVATGLVYRHAQQQDVVIVTKDEMITKSQLIDVLW